MLIPFADKKTPLNAKYSFPMGGIFHREGYVILRAHSLVYLYLDGFEYLRAAIFCDNESKYNLKYREVYI